MGWLFFLLAWELFCSPQTYALSTTGGPKLADFQVIGREGANLVALNPTGYKGGFLPAMKHRKEEPAMLLLIILILLLAGSGGYYGCGRWGYRGGAGVGLGTILILILILYMIGLVPVR